MKQKHEITIPLNDQLGVKGFLKIPCEADKVVIFSHGSGSSKHSPRNHHVANIFNNHNIATLLTDLLTPEEDSDFENRFNIDLLTERLIDITQWVLLQHELRTMSLGYFEASTGLHRRIRRIKLKNKLMISFVCTPPSHFTVLADFMRILMK